MGDGEARAVTAVADREGADAAPRAQRGGAVRRALVRARRSRWCRAAGIVAAAALAGLALIVWNVRASGRLMVRQASGAPAMPVAIVFGAGYTARGPSAILLDRVAAAVELYRLGKVRKLLMTGDNSRIGYNEPETMRETAIRMGVPARDIVLDYAGFRTYDSLYRARDIFGVRKALLVTQAYHQPRALFLAAHLGIDAVGVAADRRPYEHQFLLSLRELVAEQAAWFDVHVLRPRPHFLGKPEPIAG